MCYRVTLFNWTCSQEFRANWILWNTSCATGRQYLLEYMLSGDIELTGYCGIRRVLQGDTLIGLLSGDLELTGYCGIHRVLQGDNIS